MANDKNNINQPDSSKLNSNDYRAPKPARLPWTWKQIGYYLLPPVWGWEIAKLIGNFLLGRLIGKIALWAQSIDKTEPERAYPNYDNNFCTYDTFGVITHDGARLHTTQITPRNPAANPADQQYIINLCGNASSYLQALEILETYVKEFNCTVIGFDYRGVNWSSKSPTSKDDCVTDGIAQVQRLLDLGVTPQQIILNGHSFGGAIGTLVAAHFHQLNIPINIFNDRSFSTITNVLVGAIRTANVMKRTPSDLMRRTQEETLPRKLLGWVLKPLIKFFLSLFKWEIDAAQAYSQLPDLNKEYVLVRPAREERLDVYAHPKEDPVISHYGSLHESRELTTTRKLRKKLLTQQIADCKRLNQTDEIVRLDAEKILMRQRKARATFDAHNQPLHTLTFASRASYTDQYTFCFLPAETDMTNFTVEPHKIYFSLQTASKPYYACTFLDINGTKRYGSLATYYLDDQLKEAGGQHNERHFKENILGYIAPNHPGAIPTPLTGTDFFRGFLNRLRAAPQPIVVIDPDDLSNLPTPSRR